MTTLVARSTHPRVESGREYPIYWSLYPLAEVMSTLREINTVAAVAFERYLVEFDTFDLRDREAYRRTRKALMIVCATYRDEFPYFCRRIAEALEDLKSGKDRVVRGILEKIAKC